MLIRYKGLWKVRNGALICVLWDKMSTSAPLVQKVLFITNKDSIVWQQMPIRSFFPESSCFISNSCIECSPIFLFRRHFRNCSEIVLARGYQGVFDKLLVFQYAKRMISIASIFHFHFVWRYIWAETYAHDFHLQCRDSTCMHLLLRPTYTYGDSFIEKRNEQRAF